MGRAWSRVRAADAPWGDYGDMLVGGMATRRADGLIAIERTGPFVPPITVVGLDVLLVTDAFRVELLASGLLGLQFAKTILRRVVRLEWRHWDLSGPEPERLPPGGEPEAYILGRRHDPALADAIGRIWEVALETTREVAPADLIRALAGDIQASDDGRRWLTRHAGDWIRFDDAPYEPR